MEAKIMKSIKNFFSRQNSITRSITALVLSLILLIWPTLIDRPLVLGIGAIMVLVAVIDVIRASIRARSAARKEEGKTNAWKAIQEISLDSYFFFAGGLVFLIIPETILNGLIPVLGILLIIAAIIQLVSCLSIIKVLKKEPAGMWTSLLVPVITIGLCCAILAYTFEPAAHLLFTGITLLFYAISELARMIYFELKLSDEPQVNEAVADAAQANGADPATAKTSPSARTEEPKANEAGIDEAKAEIQPLSEKEND